MKTYLYKSLPKDMSPNGHEFVVNKWYKEDDIKICDRGFHASRRAIDAMQYVNCEVLAKVEVRGECQKQKDKECWSEMKIIKTYKWTKKDSVSLAIYAAELAEPIYRKHYSNDDRVIKAIEAAKKVLKSDTKKNRAAAAYAAADAADAARAAYAADAADAAHAARAAYAADAAHAAHAARAAHAADAADAAYAAARAAADAADAAAFEKTLDKIEKWIHKKIKF